MSVRVAVLMTAFNRKETTLQSLAAVEKLVDRSKGFETTVYLVDADSPDGTADAVRARYPDVNLIIRDRETYWARGMAIAEHQASTTDPEYYLWLNDDVRLNPDSIRDIIAFSREKGDRCIMVGAVGVPAENLATYSGMNLRSPRRPTSLERVTPLPSVLRKIDTFNGNVVLVPRHVASAVGAIDGRFGHAYADLDYGLRARRLGFSSYLLPGVIGSCTANYQEGTWRNRMLGRRARLGLLCNNKGVPPAAHLRYCVRHAGPARGVFYFAATYIRALVTIALRREP